MTKDLNIKSSTIEKGLELIKDFVEKLLGPTIDEVGLLMSDKIKYFRFKNQVKILSKAKESVKDKGIDIKEIPTKILVPLLENSSLEENEEMQNKWAFMIGNLADSKQNLQNQVFPYLLSHISLNEFEKLSEFVQQERAYLEDHIKLLEQFQKILRDEDDNSTNNEYDTLRKNVDNVQQVGFKVDGLEGFEYSNLQRLGLLKQLPKKIQIEEVEVEINENIKDHSIEALYTIDDSGYRITPLGIKFLSACNEKKTNG